MKKTTVEDINQAIYNINFKNKKDKCHKELESLFVVAKLLGYELAITKDDFCFEFVFMKDQRRYFAIAFVFQENIFFQLHIMFFHCGVEFRNSAKEKLLKAGAKKKNSRFVFIEKENDVVSIIKTLHSCI